MSETLERADEASRERAVHLAEESDDSPPDRHVPGHRTVAMISLTLALVSALGALGAGITSNEAMVVRTRQLHELADARAALAAIELRDTRRSILSAVGATPGESEAEADAAAAAQYTQRAAELRASLAEDRSAFATSLRTHERFALGSTLVSFGISLCGIVLVARNRWLWYAALVFGALGAVLVLATGASLLL